MRGLLVALVMCSSMVVYPEEVAKCRDVRDINGAYSIHEARFVLSSDNKCGHDGFSDVQPHLRGK